MPRHRGKKRQPRDLNLLAASIVEEATKEKAIEKPKEEPEKPTGEHQPQRGPRGSPHPQGHEGN